MLISELIDKLRSYKKEYGNLEVAVNTDSFSDMTLDTSRVDNVYYDSISERFVLVNEFDPTQLAFEDAMDKIIPSDDSMPSDN